MGNYTFLKARSGEIVPALAMSDGNHKPLHSMVDPRREAQRFVASVPDDTGFIILLGLGGGFTVEAALEQTAAQITVIDFDNNGIKQLLASRDYSAVLNNKRFTLLSDPTTDEIKNFILENYKPSLQGGIKIIPLRTRTESDLPIFETAASVIQEAIEIISADYSVQAYFGKRWFSNIIRNVKDLTTSCQADLQAQILTGLLNSNIKEAAIVAAGPSLDHQIPLLAEFKSRRVFIICSDTALPVLLHNGIEPDTVVSIDCQHISYYHFMSCNTARIPLVLDIASPPLLSRFSSSPIYFSSGHPLAHLITAQWQPLFYLDTSGGNVTYACLSLAGYLGIQRITLFGADFSYIKSRTYARGTYIYPFFDKKQNRFSPAQAQEAAFLYRSPFLPKSRQDQRYYETSQMRFYRKKLEEKAAAMSAEITCAKGFGAPINLQKKAAVKQTNIQKPPARALKSSADFLEKYRNDIAALPEAKNADFIKSLDINEKQIFYTLMPYMAFLKHRSPGINTKDLIEETKRSCIEEIERVNYSVISAS